MPNLALAKCCCPKSIIISHTTGKKQLCNSLSPHMFIHPLKNEAYGMCSLGVLTYSFTPLIRSFHPSTFSYWFALIVMSKVSSVWTISKSLWTMLRTKITQNTCAIMNGSRSSCTVHKGNRIRKKPIIKAVKCRRLQNHMVHLLCWVPKIICSRDPRPTGTYQKNRGIC